jgi:sugar phosphate isomerase/epimerase
MGIADALKKAGEYTGYIHLADSNRLEPGAGHTDFVSGIDALKSIGYDDWLTIESGASTDPEDALNRANEYIRSLWDA